MRTSAPPPPPTRSAPGSPTPTPRTTSGPPRRSTSKRRPTAPTPTIRRGRSSRSSTKTATRPWSPGPTGHQPRQRRLTGLAVTDDHAGVDPTFRAATPTATIGGPRRDLDLEATGTATAGQYENTGTVTGTDRRDARSPTATPRTTSAPSPGDPHREVHQRGRRGRGPGPQIPVGDPVTWTYVVTNPGNVAIADVAVTDDQPASPRSSRAAMRTATSCSTRRRPGPSRPPAPRRRASTRTSGPRRARWPAPTPGCRTPIRRTTSARQGHHHPGRRRPTSSWRRRSSGRTRSKSATSCCSRSRCAIAGRMTPWTSSWTTGSTAPSGCSPSGRRRAHATATRRFTANSGRSRPAPGRRSRSRCGRASRARSRTWPSARRPRPTRPREQQGPRER